MRDGLKWFLLNVWAWFQVVFNVRFWELIHPYNEKWDLLLKDNLRRGCIWQVQSDCYAIYGGVYIWIENYPYGCFDAMEIRNGLLHCKKIRPSRKTIYLLHRDMMNTYKKALRQRDVG